LRALSQRLREGLIAGISDCDIAGDLSASLSNVTSCSFLYCEAEELLRELEKLGFVVDSGSACTADDLQPSHVLAAMGVLTQGNLRITLRDEHDESDIDEFIEAIKRTVQAQRQS
jgi:cysteine desulfurase